MELSLQAPFWTSSLFWVLLLLFGAIVLFVRNKIRMDVVALLVIVAFALSGILSVNEVLAGFSDPNVILIALLFIVGGRNCTYRDCLSSE